MDVQTLAKSTYLSLTTFRRDGTPVATPVWLARQGHELMVFTARSSGPLLAPNFAPGAPLSSEDGTRTGRPGLLCDRVRVRA